ncbi:MAG: hypothetical protein FJ291_10190 [Planctomycetes bacterium]|nr:hypothetical protein [Planctomycetota bacterium]
MRRIIKRVLRRDSHGVVHFLSLQELRDDEQGTIDELVEETLSRCQSCAHPLERLADVRACDRCRVPCCDLCSTPCAACSRRLCAECRRGSTDPRLTLCPECLADLAERLEQQREDARQTAEFDRLLTVYREQARLIGSGLFSNYPLGGLIEQIAGLSLARKLGALERRTRDHDRRR